MGELLLCVFECGFELIDFVFVLVFEFLELVVVVGEGVDESFLVDFEQFELSF